MKRTYTLGLDSNKINTSLTVGTAGVAYTAVYLRKEGETPEKVLESNTHSGNISETFLRKALKLKSYFIQFTTYIDFQAFDKSLWENLKNDSVVIAHLGGGFSGNQAYKSVAEEVHVSEEGQKITITLLIEFI